MKLFNIKHPEDLMKVIDSCEGKVELVSTDGDRINLKSKLSKFVALNKILSAESMVPELEIVAYEPKDTEKIMNYMMNMQN